MSIFFEIELSNPLPAEVTPTQTGDVCPDAASFARATLAFVPDRLQSDVLNHFALRHPNSTTLLAAPTLRQSKHLLHKILAFAALAGQSVRPHPAGGIRLTANGARIVALPGTPQTIRGFSADLIVIDEAAFTNDELFAALNPALAATNGALWLFSTANRTQGYFFELHTQRPESWTFFQISATFCPRISEEFLNHQQLLLGDQEYQREFLCQFHTSRKQFMPRELIESLFTSDFDALEIDYAF